jgi:hypothetical protein
MNDKYESIAELVEINRKKISSMFAKKPVNLTLAQECLIDIKALLDELYHNNKFIALSQATKNFGGTTSLCLWPEKNKLTEAHLELIRLLMPTFGVSVLDLDKLLGNDKNFNRECVETCHIERSAYMERSFSLGRAMKILFENNEFDTLEKLIPKARVSSGDRHGVMDTNLISLLDVVIRNPNKTELEEYFVKNIAPALESRSIKTYSQINNLYSLEYVKALINIDKNELAKIVFDRLDIDYYEAIQYFKLAEKLKVNDIPKPMTCQLVGTALAHGRLASQDKVELLYWSIRQSQQGAFEALSKIDWFNFSVTPDELNSICKRFKQSSNKVITKKLDHAMEILIMRDIEQSEKAGAVAVQQRIEWMRKLPALALQMEKIPKLQRHRLESDLSL